MRWGTRGSLREAERKHSPANEVYLRTHDGLSNMVSARAAARVLDDALRTAGYSATSISARQMRDLLLGSVLQDLQAVLPSQGLRRNLQELADSLASRVEERREDRPSAPPPPLQSPGDDGKRHSTPSRPPPKPTREDSGDASAREVNNPRHPTMRAPTGPSGKAHSLDQLQQAILRLARVEHITLVAAVRRSGEVVTSRGNGYDLAALSRLGLSSLRLLGRSGRLLSYYLSHSQGQLFLLPLGSDVLITVGTPALKLGAVFTAFTTLKEEL